MATTTYLEWDDQATGANDNTWGDVLDANQTIFETAIARLLSLSTTGGTTSLTSSQNRYPIIVITGTLVSNATINVRAAEKNWIFINQTSGAFTLRVKTSGGTGKYIPRGRATKLYCDGTNVLSARAPGIPFAVAGGGVNAITASFEPELAGADLEIGQTMWLVEAAGANTSSSPTFTPDGGTTYNIKKYGNASLRGGDIYGAGHLCLFVLASASRVELLNPAGLASDTAPGIVELATTAETIALTDAIRAVTPAALFALLGKGSSVVGGTTISLGDGGLFTITGSGWNCTDIDFATANDGRHALLYINASGTFTHNATSLPLPGGADIAVSAGDLVEVWQRDTDNVNVAIHRADGRAHVETWQYIETLTASSSANLTTASLANYSMIRVTLSNVRPATDGAMLNARISSDGSTFLNSGYEGWSDTKTPSTSTGAAADTGGALTGGVGNATSDGPISGQILFGNFNVARKTAIQALLTYGNGSAAFRTVETQSLNDQSTAMTHIRFVMDSGDIASGSIVIEGRR
jgi:hypothetical protein